MAEEDSSLWSSLDIEDACSLEATEAILGSQYFPGHGWLTLNSDEHDASFQRLEPVARDHSIEDLDGIAAHATFTVPDNPPSKSSPRETTIHRFKLKPELSSTINRLLQSSETLDELRRAQSEFLRVSNVDRAFHRHRKP